MREIEIRPGKSRLFNVSTKAQLKQVVVGMILRIPNRTGFQFYSTSVPASAKSIDPLLNYTDL